MAAENHIEVCTDWQGFGEPTCMGVLSSEVVRNCETSRFSR